jgi:hypothetical protein
VALRTASELTHSPSKQTFLVTWQPPELLMLVVVAMVPASVVASEFAQVKWAIVSLQMAAALDHVSLL